MRQFGGGSVESVSATVPNQPLRIDYTPPSACQCPRCRVACSGVVDARRAVRQKHPAQSLQYCLLVLATTIAEDRSQAIVSQARALVTRQLYPRGENAMRSDVKQTAMILYSFCSVVARFAMIVDPCVSAAKVPPDWLGPPSLHSFPLSNHEICPSSYPFDNQ
jgi:hypothetical protein